MFIGLCLSNKHYHLVCYQFSSVQSLSCVQLFVTPWTAACQASLSITSSQSLLKLMSIELVMPSNHFILCCPLLLLPSIFPRIRVFSRLFASGGQSSGASASASVPPMNIQGWFPLGLTGLISLQSKGFSKVFSKPQFESINSSVLSLLYGPAVILLGHVFRLVKTQIAEPHPQSLSRSRVGQRICIYNKFPGDP